MKKPSKRIVKTLLVGIVVIITLAMAGFVVWGSNPLKAIKDELNLATNDADVKISNTNEYISIEPKDYDNSSALIYYPGARVEPEAYIYKLTSVAKNTGLKIFITKPFLNFAIFGINDADKIITTNTSIPSWYIGGHSLGGAMSCRYVESHYKSNNEIKGLILFGSYCDVDISSSQFNTLSISGSNDGLSTTNKIESYKHNLPTDASVVFIQGMNHAQNGNYGKQDGDIESTIDDNLAKDKTVESIVGFLQK